MELERVPPNRSGRELARRGVLAAFVALLVNLGLLAVILETGLVSVFGPLDPTPVATLTVLGAVGATAVYGVVDRRSQRPDRDFLVVALVALALSVVPTLALLVVDPAASVGGVAILLGMHVATAIVCIGALTDLV